MADNVDDGLMLSILREIRREQADLRVLLLGLVDFTRKLDQRMDARMTSLESRMVSVRDDLELLLRSELLGKLTNFETRIEQRIAELESRT